MTSVPAPFSGWLLCHCPHVPVRAIGCILCPQVCSGGLLLGLHTAGGGHWTVAPGRPAPWLYLWNSASVGWIDLKRLIRGPGGVGGVLRGPGEGGFPARRGGLRASWHRAPEPPVLGLSALGLLLLSLLPCRGLVLLQPVNPSLPCRLGTPLARGPSGGCTDRDLCSPGALPS